MVQIVTNRAIGKSPRKLKYWELQNTVNIYNLNRANRFVHYIYIYAQMYIYIYLFIHICI
jgi:hypothetical protein